MASLILRRSVRPHDLHRFGRNGGTATMTLGEWIDTLATLSPDAEVMFDFGATPSGLRSWRGVYEQLTLDSNATAPPNTVAALLADAKRAVGATFEGYKGGEYVMGRDTPVWADEWGDSSGRMLVGVVKSGEKVILKTFIAPSEYDRW